MVLLAHVELHTAAKKHSTPNFIFSSAANFRDGEGVLDQPFPFSVTYNEAAGVMEEEEEICCLREGVQAMWEFFSGCFGIYGITCWAVFP